MPMNPRALSAAPLTQPGFLVGTVDYLAPEQIDGSVYRFHAREAARHLFRVSSGLDSMVLGEPEITGQVKQAWALAQAEGTTGRFLDAVMQKALTVSKRIRTETAIGESPASVSSVELRPAKSIRRLS